MCSYIYVFLTRIIVHAQRSINKIPRTRVVVHRQYTLRTQHTQQCKVTALHTHHNRIGRQQQQQQLRTSTQHVTASSSASSSSTLSSSAKLCNITQHPTSAALLCFDSALLLPRSPRKLGGILDPVRQQQARNPHAPNTTVSADSKVCVGVSACSMWSWWWWWWW